MTFSGWLTGLSRRPVSAPRDPNKAGGLGRKVDGMVGFPQPIHPVNALLLNTTRNFQELAFEIFSLYIDPNEIPSRDLKEIVNQSYSNFRASDVTPLVTLDQQKQFYLLELFHGPTFAFKDVALQLLGNLFEYFLVRKNGDKPESEREHLTVVGATSGDTGSAAIYGLRSKKDVSAFIGPFVCHAESVVRAVK